MHSFDAVVNQMQVRSYREINEQKHMFAIRLILNVETPHFLVF